MPIRLVMNAMNTDAVISLGRPTVGTRLLHRFIFGSLGLIAAAVLMAGVVPGEAPGELRAILAAIGGVLLIAVEATRREHLREIEPGWIKLADGQLSIEHPPLLKEPLVVPLAEIRTAATDGTDDAEHARTIEGVGPGFAFPVTGSRDGPLADKVRGHLWAPLQPFPIRRLGQRAQRPNLVVFFERPIVCPTLRRLLPHGPSESEALGAIALRVPDAEATRALLAASGTRDGIDEADVDLLEAINSGALAAADPAITYEQAEEQAFIKWGWGVAFAGLALPSVQILALRAVFLAWRIGEYAHAIGIAIFALAISAFEVALLVDAPVEQPGRFVAGALLASLAICWGTWRRFREA